MILKLVLLLSLIPLGVAIFVGRVLGRARLNELGEHKVPLSAEATLRRLLANGNSLKLVVKKRVFGAPVGADSIFLTEEEATDSTATAVGRAVWLAGLAEIASTTPAVLKFWKGARTFGSIGPPFILMILVFALIAARFSASTVLYLGISSLGLAAAMCLLQLATLRTAARYGIVRMEKAGLFSKLADEEAVADAARAWAMEEAMPVCLRLGWGQKTLNR